MQIANATPGRHELILAFRKQDETINMRCHLKTIVDIFADGPKALSPVDQYPEYTEMEFTLSRTA